MNQTPILFWTNTPVKMILPATKSVPELFIAMFSNMDTPKNLDDILIPIEINIDENTVTKHMQNLIFVDILIGYIALDIDIVQLSAMINKTASHINICKDTVIRSLKNHIESIGTDTYVWNLLANKLEYTYYQFKKRNWPVNKDSNIDWQNMAKKIGLVDKVYPGAVHNQNPRVANRIEVKAPECDDVIEGKINAAEDVLDEIDIGSDLDDEDDVNLLQLLNDKQKQVRRDEKLRKLRLESNYATYSIPDIKEIDAKHGFTCGDAVNIFDAIIALDQRELATLYVCRLAVSRKYYHIAIKNVPLMERIKKLMKDNLRIHRLIKYVMSYSFYMMLKEERLLGRRITENNRSIMDEDEFRALPVFDCELEESPYNTEIYHSNKDKNMREQLPVYLHGTREFTSRNEFIRRLSILTGGMLDNIDLSEDNAFLTGSSLVPCVVTNPLEDNFKRHDEPFAVYLENYYPSYSSIAVYRRKFEHAKKQVILLFDTAFTNRPAIKSVYTNIKDDDMFVSCITGINSEHRLSDRLIVAVDTLTNTYNELLLMEKKLADLDIAVIANTREEYDKNVLSIFNKIRANIPQGDEHHIYLYKQPLKYGFKWVLKGIGVKRPIDFFKICTPPYVLLHRFHLNIVRFWWDGKKIRALGSGVCAALTGVNQWYRWFSNNKDPMSIVLKNMQRGYTTLLNDKEIDTLRAYINDVDAYKHLIGKFTIGKIHKHHTLFGHEGGIRYEFPDLLIVCEQYIDTPQYWATHDYILTRLGCSLDTNSYGKIVVPKIYAFESIIKDLLD